MCRKNRVDNLMIYSSKSLDDTRKMNNFNLYYQVKYLITCQVGILMIYRSKKCEKGSPIAHTKSNTVKINDHI